MSLRESESWVQFLVISVHFCQLRNKYHVIRASAETCYECLRGENKQKLEVLSFEKAWDKIEKDIVGAVLFVIKSKKGQFFLLLGGVHR